MIFSHLCRFGVYLTQSAIERDIYDCGWITFLSRNPVCFWKKGFSLSLTKKWKYALSQCFSSPPNVRLCVNVRFPHADMLCPMSSQSQLSRYAAGENSRGKWLDTAAFISLLLLRPHSPIQEFSIAVTPWRKWYRAWLKGGPQVAWMLQAKPGRSGKQEE